MNSYHKVVRLVRNITLKLWADSPNQYVRNAQNYGKTNHGFCTMITLQYTHRCLYVGFWPKTKLGPLWLFPLPKTEDTNKRKVACYDWGEKKKNRKIETRTVGDTNKRVSEVFWGLVFPRLAKKIENNGFFLPHLVCLIFPYTQNWNSSISNVKMRAPGKMQCQPHLQITSFAKFMLDGSVLAY